MPLKSKADLIRGLEQSAKNMIAISAAREAEKAATTTIEPGTESQTQTGLVSPVLTIDQVKG